MTCKSCVTTCTFIYDYVVMNPVSSYLKLLEVCACNVTSVIYR